MSYYRRGSRRASRRRERTPEVRIEYPSRGATYCRKEFGVYEYSEYPASSVLAGRERRVFLTSFDTLEEAQSAYPKATYTGPGYREDAMLDLPGPDDADPYGDARREQDE